MPGWNGGGTTLANPRPPAAPATLDLTLEDYFSAAALIGVLAAQRFEPDRAWASKWANDMGELMAAEAQRRRFRHRRRP
jgi:hypothetical protein